jgi:hypothetical protein
MAKKPKVEEAPVQETKAVVAPPVAQPVLNMAGASPELQAKLEMVAENFESVDSYRLPKAKMTAEGFELVEGEQPVKELEGVIVHTSTKNVYYSKPFNRNDVTAPDCFSNDGKTPDKSIQKPVNPTCKGCPMAEFGTNSMKSGKACRNLKPLYILLHDESIMPRQVVITPVSLRAVTDYLANITERGLPYRQVKTKITAFKKDNADTYMTLKFAMGERLSAERIKDVEALKKFWLPIMATQTVEVQEDAAPAADSKGEF